MRYLVHGPCLQDATDLLFFDALVFPFTQAMRRPKALAPGLAQSALPFARLAVRGLARFSTIAVPAHLLALRMWIGAAVALAATGCCALR